MVLAGVVLAGVVLNSAQVSLSSEILLLKCPHLQPIFFSSLSEF